jgi:hypothetical protein
MARPKWKLYFACWYRGENGTQKGWMRTPYDPFPTKRAAEAEIVRIKRRWVRRGLNDLNEYKVVRLT